MSHVGTVLHLGYFSSPQVHDRRHILQIPLSERLPEVIPKEKFLQLSSIQKQQIKSKQTIKWQSKPQTILTPVEIKMLPAQFR